MTNTRRATRFLPGLDHPALPPRLPLDGDPAFDPPAFVAEPPPDMAFVADATVAVEDAMARDDRFPSSQQTAFTEVIVPPEIEDTSDYPGAEAGVLGSSFTGSTVPYAPPSGPTQIPSIDALD